VLTLRENMHKRLAELPRDTRFETIHTNKHGLVMQTDDGCNRGRAGWHRKVLLTWDGPVGVRQEVKVCHGDVVVRVTA
jgi:hypothetical protein